MESVPKQKLPNCPKCGLDELWVVVDGVAVVDVLMGGETITCTYRLRCYNCGLDAGTRVVADGETHDESIAKIVAVIAALYAKMTALGAWIIR